MNEKMSRRDFLKAAGAVLVDAAVPKWIKRIKEEDQEVMYSVKALLDLMLEKDEELQSAGYEGWREDLAATEDFDEAINLSYSFLESSGVYAFEFFVEKGWFEGEG